MSADLLCDVCPSFGPCHIGEDVDDEHCWNWRRDAGLPLDLPPPEVEERPVKAPRPKRTREPGPPKAPRPKRTRVQRAQRRTSDELLEIRRGNLIIPYEERYGAYWARLFGEGVTPPIRSKTIVGRPDLWKYAEARMAAKSSEAALRSELTILSRISLERLHDPMLLCTPLGVEIYGDTKSAKFAATAIRRYRIFYSIDMTADRAAVTQSRRDAGKVWNRDKLAKAFGGRDPPVPVLALVHRPDLWEFAEKALTAGFSDMTVTTNARRLAHISAEDLTDPSKTAHNLAPGDGGTVKFLRGAIVRFRKVMMIGGSG